jgi:hypothetical protein
MKDRLDFFIERLLEYARTYPAAELSSIIELAMTDLAEHDMNRAMLEANNE